MGARSFSSISCETFGIAVDIRRQIPAGPRDNDERRADPRYACEYPAQIFSADSAIELKGRIVNISASGAKVSVVFPKQGPSTVFLVDLAHNDAYECDVRWRANDSIGVRFVDLLGAARKRRLLAGQRLDATTAPHAILDIGHAPSGAVRPGPPPESLHSGLAHIEPAGRCDVVGGQTLAPQSSRATTARRLMSPFS